MDHPAPIQICSGCRNTITRSYLLYLAKLAGYPVEIDAASVEELQRPIVLPQEMEEPLERIARKRSFVVRFLSTVDPKTRRMDRAFIIGACIPVALSCLCCVMAPPRNFDFNNWCMILPILASCVACGFFALILTGLFTDSRAVNRPAVSMSQQDRDTVTKKVGNLADTEQTTSEDGITPSPSQGTIQPDPKPEEPSDA
jgi:hypothetical protein